MISFITFVRKCLSFYYYYKKLFFQLYFLTKFSIFYLIKALFIIQIKQIWQYQKLMFSMTSLQSQNSPLRTLQTFYQPKNRANSKNTKKTFHDFMKNSEIQQLYNPNAKQMSIKKYLDNIQKNRSLQRRPLGKQNLYSFITFRRAQNEQSQSNSVISKQKSLSSIKLSTIAGSRTQSLCSILDKKHKLSLKKQLPIFYKQIKTQQKDQKDKLRFTFYNNHQKQSYIMDKYNQDVSLDQRKTNLYQNVFNRKIAQESLLEMIANLDRKRKKGDCV